MTGDSGNKSAKIVHLNPPNSQPDEIGSSLYQGVAQALPEMPTGLTAAQKNFWNDFGEKLITQGLISELDLSAYHRYVVAYCEWRKMVAEVKKHGETVTFENGVVQVSTWAVLRDRAANELRRLEAQFGLTPRARQAIKIEKNPAQSELGLD